MMAAKKRQFQFFIPSTPLGLKILSSIFLLCVFSSLIGIFFDVLIDTWLVNKLYWVAGGLSLVMLLMVSISLLNPNSEYRARTIGGVGGVWKMVFGMVVGIPLLMFMGVCNGVPTLVHLLLPTEQRAVVVTVDHKSHGYYNKSCNGELFIKEFDGFLSNVCGIQKADWQQIKDGQKMMLIGQRSAIGFSYSGYRLP